MLSAVPTAWSPGHKDFVVVVGKVLDRIVRMAFEWEAAPSCPFDYRNQTAVMGKVVGRLDGLYSTSTWWCC